MSKKKKPRSADDPNRRLLISCPAELREALRDFADATQAPGVASVATLLLVEMIPQLHDLAKVTRHARAGRTGAMKQALRHMVGDAMAEAMTFKPEQKSLALKWPGKDKDAK